MMSQWAGLLSTGRWRTIVLTNVGLICQEWRGGGVDRNLFLAKMVSQVTTDIPQFPSHYSDIIESDITGVLF